MARTKSYNRDSAVEAAMVAFWKHGFGSIGVRQLEAETSINRFALQTDFGGKQGLFLEALERYLTISDENALKPLKVGGLDALIGFFQQLVEGEDGDPKNTGCLMVNTVIENADLKIEEVEKITTAHYENMLKMFEFTLRCAQNREEIRPDFDLTGASRMLLTFAMGVEVYIRMKSDLNAAKEQVEFLISEIEGWRVGK